MVKESVTSGDIQEENPLDDLHKLTLSNVNKVIMSNININSLPAKFDQVKEVILKNVDILVVTETKLDEIFPLAQFYVERFTMPYRLDRNRNGGSVIIYVRGDIPSKLLERHKLPHDIEGVFIELNFKKSNGCFLEPITPRRKMTSAILRHLIKL